MLEVELVLRQQLQADGVHFPYTGQQHRHNRTTCQSKGKETDARLEGSGCQGHGFTQFCFHDPHNPIYQTLSNVLYLWDSLATRAILTGMLPINVLRSPRSVFSRYLSSRLHPSQMVLQKSTVGELPFYYGGPSNRPAVIVLQVRLIGNTALANFPGRTMSQAPCYLSMTFA